jgi:Zn-dependent protease
MTWRDRDYGADSDADDFDGGSAAGPWGRPGGNWAGMRPTVDNPFTWSLPIARISGITVRVHLFFLVYIIVQLAQGALPVRGTTIDFSVMALAMTLLFVVVLAHEFGHCLACRLCGGVADEILMWPLGGLAATQPLHTWRAHLLTTLGGPLVNLAICLVAGSMLYVITRNQLDWLQYVLPNPLHIGDVLVGSPLNRSMAHQALYLTHAISLVLLLFNLMPVFPLDGGRFLAELLWPRYGYSRSMRYAVRVGYIGALAMCVFGMISNQWSVIGVGVFGLIACYTTHRQLEFSDALLAHDANADSDEYAMSVHGSGEDDQQRLAQRTHGAQPTRGERSEQRRLQQEQDEAAEVDRILLKIKQHGMASLTRAERSTLRQATDRKRKGEV